MAWQQHHARVFFFARQTFLIFHLLVIHSSQSLKFYPTEHEYCKLTCKYVKVIKMVLIKKINTHLHLSLLQKLPQLAYLIIPKTTLINILQ